MLATTLWRITRNLLRITLLICSGALTFCNCNIWFLTVATEVVNDGFGKRYSRASSAFKEMLR